MKKIASSGILFVVFGRNSLALEGKTKISSPPGSLARKRLMRIAFVPHGTLVRWRGAAPGSTTSQRPVTSVIFGLWAPVYTSA
jgi:hypothetical protein